MVTLARMWVAVVVLLSVHQTLRGGAGATGAFAASLLHVLPYVGPAIGDHRWTVLRPQVSVQSVPNNCLSVSAIPAQRL